MKTIPLQTKFIIIATTLAALSSCGSSGVTETGSVGQPQTDMQAPVPMPGFNAGYAPYNHYFTTCGREPTAISGMVRTDNVLNIRVKAESAPQNGCYADANKVIPYQAKYSCARFKVIMQVKTGPNAQNPVDAAGDSWIERATFMTPPLAAPGTQGCSGSQNEVIYNMSNYLFPGHGLVRFKMESAETNFLCNHYQFCKKPENAWTYDCAWARTMSSDSVCPFKPVYQYHKVAGQIDVQTDGSTL